MGVRRCSEPVQEMGDAGLIRPNRLHFETVTPRQPAARREPEDDAPARLVFDDRVADRAVAAVGADPERAIEDHRLGQPDVARPDPIDGTAEGVEDAADERHRRLDLAGMDVLDLAHHILISIRLSTVTHTLAYCPYGRV
jgi:hypothetical protein